MNDDTSVQPISRLEELQPRFLRQSQAWAYLGIDRNKFDAEVRPYITEIPLGKRAVGYDRRDLDAWADAYKSAHGRPGKPLDDLQPLGGRSLRPPDPEELEHQLAARRRGRRAIAAAPSVMQTAIRPDRGNGKPLKLSSYERALESCFQVSRAGKAPPR